jgi:hypothetical protein
VNKPRTEESSTTLLHNAMSSSARLSQKARAILAKQLREIERELKNPGLQPGRRLELVDALLTTMSALDKSANDAVKLLKGAPPIQTDTPSQEEIMRQLIHGKTKSNFE